MEVKQEQIISRFFDQREASKTQKGISIFLMVELADGIDLPKSSVARELLADGFHDRIQNFCRNQDHHFNIAKDRAIVVLNGITKTSQLHLAARKLLQQFDDPLSIVDDKILLAGRAAFVIPTAKVTRLNELIDAAEQAIQVTDKENPYAIHKLGDEIGTESHGPSDADVRQAMDSREFQLETRKILHTTYGSVVGYQTSLNWTSKEWGKVTANSPLINSETKQALSHFHIRAAVKQLAEMPENSTIEVETLPEELCSADFMAILSDTCGFHDVTPDRVRVALATTVDTQHRNYLEALSEAGFGITLKNFGITTNIADMMDLPCTIIETATFPDSRIHSTMAAMIHDLGKQAHTRIHAEPIPEWVKASNYDAVTVG